MTDKTRELVEQIKQYASEHYNDGGWDVVVETYEDEQIAEQIKGARSLSGAIKKFAPLIDIWADRQADAVISAGEQPTPTKRATKAPTDREIAAGVEATLAAKAETLATERAPKSKLTASAARRKPAAKPAGARVAKKAAPSVDKLSSDSDVIPTDPAKLRQLIKITRDRRWRAGRRDDAALVEQMSAKLVKLTEALAKASKPTAPAKKATPAKKAPAKKASANPAENVVPLRSRARRTSTARIAK